MSAKSSGDQRHLSVTKRELNVDHENVNENIQPDDNFLPARTRVLSEKGEKYFLDTCLKNRNKSHRKVLALVKNVDDLLKIDSLEEVCEKVKTLVEVHKEFQCSHLRYQELLHQASITEEDPLLGQEVSQSVSECVARVHGKMPDSATPIEPGQEEATADDLQQKHRKDDGDGEIAAHVLAQTNETALMDQIINWSARRQSLYEDIKASIQTAEVYIQNDDLTNADLAQGKIENQFAEFMTYDPQCYPDQGNLVDIDKEREFTHQVDDAVFAIRKKLSDAKSALESCVTHLIVVT